MPETTGPVPVFYMIPTPTSSNVEATGYDAASSTLAVQYKGGAVYHYEGVTPGFAEDLAAAKSVGAYIAKVIKPAFTGVLQPTVEAEEKPEAKPEPVLPSEPPAAAGRTPWPFPSSGQSESTGPEPGITQKAPELELPRYRSHKIVRALQLATIEKNLDGSASVWPGDARFPVMRLGSPVVTRYFPVVGDYYVIYEDGYQAISPKKAFEDGYTRVDV